MWEVERGPADQRRIAALKETQHVRQDATTGCEHAEPKHGRRQPIRIEATNEPVEGVPTNLLGQGVQPEDHKLTKQWHSISPVPLSPPHFSKRAQALTADDEPTKEPRSYTLFLKDWRHRRIIGEGSDGVVHQYKQRKRKGISIAVKVPRSSSTREDILQEVTNMRRIGRHDHILELLSTCSDWYPFGPALFLPYCELGDLIMYRETWCAYQAFKGQPERVSEITMCKLFRDVALALDYLHNKLGSRYVHNDLKPQNILAFMPDEGIDSYSIPEQPTFKLSDFARLTPWPTPHGSRPQGFWGTPEYGPPEKEQLAPIRPPADIWALGATMQYMALGICPTQSKEAFIWSRKAENKTCPRGDDEAAWKSEYWRSRIPTVFRPINVPVSVLRNYYDTPYDLGDYQPFSARLGFWYAQLWKSVGSRRTDRPSAARLVREAVPNIEDQIECLKVKKRTKQILHVSRA